MTGTVEKYAEAFKRTNIIDATGLYPGGMKIKDLSNFTLERTELYQSTLIIVNTTACALEIFSAIKENMSGRICTFHLSNNMCTAT